MKKREREKQKDKFGCCCFHETAFAPSMQVMDLCSTMMQVSLVSLLLKKQKKKDFLIETSYSMNSMNSIIQFLWLALGCERAKNFKRNFQIIIIVIISSVRSIKNWNKSVNFVLAPFEVNRWNVKKMKIFYLLQYHESTVKTPTFDHLLSAQLFRKCVVLFFVS